MSSRELVEGVPLIRVPDQVYQSCLTRKQAHTPFPKASTFRASAPLKLVYIDICGQISPSTLGGSHYFLLIVDDYSRLMWVALLKNKSDAFRELKHFKTLAEAEKNTKIKCLRSSKGGEFVSNEFTDFCVSQGIKRQLIAPYSPQ